MRSRATIKDVAKAAGVATSTVSRALAQPGRVSDEMRRRVVVAATELGYYPNPHARSLISGRTSSAALLIPDITNPYFFGLVRGMQAQAKSRGYRQLLVDTGESADVEAGYLAELPKSVDGAVVAASRLSDSQLQDVAGHLPLVVINRDIPSLPAVIIDTPAGVVQALEHLVSLGHTDLAFAAGPATSWSSRKRWDALRKAARRRGVSCHRIGPFAPTRQAGAAAADAAVLRGVTACLFFNDLLAIGALQRFAERGIGVPEQMSVVGCDDIFGADFCNPPLTTLTAPIERAGRVATDMLLDGLDSEVAGTRSGRYREELPTSLTIRRSTGPAPALAAQ